MPLTRQKVTEAAPTGVRTAQTTKPVRGRMPTKVTINFAQIDVKPTRWWLVLLTVVLILAVGAVLGKFLVYDRFTAATAAQAEAAEMHRALAECNARIDSYGELNETYAHYTYTGMTDEELARVGRIDVLDLMQRVVFPRTDISSWSLKDNTLSLSIEGDNLQEINETVQQLMSEPLVGYCEVHTATTDVRQSGFWYRDPDKVTANIVVYLNKPEEGTQK